MSRVWQIQEAKNRLSEVVDEAVSNGPQIITRRGVETAIVLSYREYRRLVLEKQSLSAFFRESPLVDAELDFSRDKSESRDVDLG